MPGKKRTEAMDRARQAAEQLKPMAEQMKPLAQEAGEATRRQLFRTRVWAAPQVERAGKAFEDTVAPKVSAMLSSAAERIDPTKPRRGRWRKPAGIAAALTAAAGAAAAVFRNRIKIAITSPDDDFGASGTTGSGAAGASATDAGTSAEADTVVSESEHEAHVN